MRVRRAARAMGLGLCALLGCEGASVAPPDVAEVPPSVDCGLSIGARDGAFGVIAAGQVVRVVMGSQGGYHLTLALRAGAPAGAAYVDLEIVRGDGAVIGGGRACVALSASPTVPGATESQDMRAIFDDTNPAVLRGEGLAVTVRARLRSGADMLACRPPSRPGCDARASVALRAVY